VPPINGDASNQKDDEPFLNLHNAINYGCESRNNFLMIQNIFYMKSFPADILKEYDDVLSFFYFKCFIADGH